MQDHKTNIPHRQMLIKFSQEKGEVGERQINSQRKRKTGDRKQRKEKCQFSENVNSLREFEILLQEN